MKRLILIAFLIPTSPWWLGVEAGRHPRLRHHGVPTMSADFAMGRTRHADPRADGA
jgi:hypothetical protein